MNKICVYLLAFCTIGLDHLYGMEGLRKSSPKNALTSSEISAFEPGRYPTMPGNIGVSDKRSKKLVRSTGYGYGEYGDYMQDLATYVKAQDQIVEIDRKIEELKRSAQRYIGIITYLFTKDRLIDIITHPFTKDGVIDIGCAWTLGMGILVAHELGHGLMARLLWGLPLDIVIGTMSSPEITTPLAQFGGIKLSGVGWCGYNLIPKELALKNSLQTNLVLAAGPLCGALASIPAIRALKKKKKSYFTKAAGWYLLYWHTLGAGGIGGRNRPGTDFYYMMHGFK